MTRFAKIQTKDEKAVDGIGDNYKLGHHDDIDYEFKSKKGLTENVVRDISKRKNEPEWMLEIRLKALEKYYQMKIPKWGGDIDQIDFELQFVQQLSDIRAKDILPRLRQDPPLPGVPPR